MDDVRELFQIFVRRFGLLNAGCCDSCCGQDISLVQSYILFEVNRQNSPSMQQVAEALGIDITTFSRQIKTLEKKGLIRKEQDPSDRRINILKLTPEGEMLERQIDARMKKFIEKILSQFTEFEREMVIKSIRMLNKAIIGTGSCC